MFQMNFPLKRQKKYQIRKRRILILKKQRLLKSIFMQEIRFSLQADGKLVEELVSKRELGPDEDYYSSEMVISSRDISDRSLLKQY